MTLLLFEGQSVAAVAMEIAKEAIKWDSLCDPVAFVVRPPCTSKQLTSIKVRTA